MVEVVFDGFLGGRARFLGLGDSRTSVEHHVMEVPVEFWRHLVSVSEINRSVREIETISSLRGRDSFLSFTGPKKSSFHLQINLIDEVKIPLQPCKRHYILPVLERLKFPCRAPN